MLGRHVGDHRQHLGPDLRAVERHVGVLALRHTDHLLVAPVGEKLRRRDAEGLVDADDLVVPAVVCAGGAGDGVVQERPGQRGLRHPEAVQLLVLLAATELLEQGIRRHVDAGGDAVGQGGVLAGEVQAGVCVLEVLAIVEDGGAHLPQAFAIQEVGDMGEGGPLHTFGIVHHDGVVGHAVADEGGGDALVEPALRQQRVAVTAAVECVIAAIRWPKVQVDALERDLVQEAVELPGEEVACVGGRAHPVPAPGLAVALVGEMARGRDLPFRQTARRLLVLLGDHHRGGVGSEDRTVLLKPGEALLQPLPGLRGLLVEREVEEPRALPGNLAAVDGRDPWSGAVEVDGEAVGEQVQRVARGERLDRRGQQAELQGKLSPGRHLIGEGDLQPRLITRTQELDRPRVLGPPT